MVSKKIDGIAFAFVVEISLTCKDKTMVESDVQREPEWKKF